MTRVIPGCELLYINKSTGFTDSTGVGGARLSAPNWFVGRSFEDTVDEAAV